MGKKLDTLLGRNKFKTLLKLAISRSAVLKNLRQVRCSQARSDVSQLLTLDRHQRALLRVEYVIKEQKMFDVFVMIEGYCHTLIERIVLIENNKECPEELKEEISSLVFAASRCGEFPELQEIRGVFWKRFGKEFVDRAVDLRSNCGVNPKMIQKLSNRQPSLENRMVVLQEIASQSGISLQLEDMEAPSAINKEKMETKQNQNQGNLDHVKLEDESKNLRAEIDKDEQFSVSMETRMKYKDISTAAQAAFQSAPYAAEAKRAAVELSRSKSQDPDDQNSPIPIRSFRTEENESLKPETPRTSINGLGFKKTHLIKNSDSESEGEGLVENQREIHSEKLKGGKNEEESKRTSYASSLDYESEGEELVENQREIHSEKLKGGKNEEGLERTSYASGLDFNGGTLKETEPLEKEIVFDVSDDESKNEEGQIPWLKHRFDEKSHLPTNEFPKMRSNTIMDKNITDEKESNKLHHPYLKRISLRSRADPHNLPGNEDHSVEYSSEGHRKETAAKMDLAEQVHVQPLTINRKPVSVRTRRVFGQ